MEEGLVESGGTRGRLTAWHGSSPRPSAALFGGFGADESGRRDGRARTGPAAADQPQSELLEIVEDGVHRRDEDEGQERRRQQAADQNDRDGAEELGALLPADRDREQGGHD